MHRSLARWAARVLCKDYPHARLITLNNPKSLNSIDYDMVQDLHRLYLTEPAPASSLYVLKGAGPKAFSAGGDVVSITSNRPPGCARNFFYWEYQVDHAVSHLPGGQVCLWDGYVMGGGVGVSVGSAYRVASEKACFAMPETAIGMIPDVGASWFLPRLSVPGLGLYMGLTGDRLRGADLVHLGLATHYVPSEKMEALESELCSIADAADVEAVLERHAISASQLPPCTIAGSFPFLRDHFDLCPGQSIVSLLKACRAHADRDPLAKTAAEVIPTYSPTALVLALEVLQRGKKMNTPVEAFAMEYCASQHIVSQHDFPEGVRALLIDKDKSPQWSPSTLEEVSPEAVEAYFRPTTPNQPIWDPVRPVPPITSSL